MCLITEQKEPEILKEDLIVYKDIKDTEDLQGRLIYKAHMYNFEYELGKEYETNLVADNSFQSMADDRVGREYNLYGKHMLVDHNRTKELTHVHQGFHSMLTPKRYDLGGVLFECLIPKGSMVYRDKTDLIVSNKIKIVRRLKKTLKNERLNIS